MRKTSRKNSPELREKNKTCAKPAALWNRLALSFSGALQNAGEVQERMRMYHTQEDERK